RGLRECNSGPSGQARRSDPRAAWKVRSPRAPPPSRAGRQRKSPLPRTWRPRCAWETFYGSREASGVWPCLTRASPAARATISIDALISSSVVRRESENRITLFASERERPSERIAGEGASVPLEHALPAEAATPSRSSRIKSASAEQRSKRMADVLGRRGPPPPTARDPSTRDR